MQSWIKSSIDQGFVSCPHSACKVQLSKVMILKLVPDIAFKLKTIEEQQYAQRTISVADLAHESVPIVIYIRTEGCSRMTCAKCNTHFCDKCNYVLCACWLITAGLQSLAAISFICCETCILRISLLKV